MPLDEYKYSIYIHKHCLQKKFKVETEVENWIQKYDQEMGERQVKENQVAN